MAYLIYLVVVIVMIKLAFDFVGNTTRIASALEDIAASMKHNDHKSKKTKETEQDNG